MTSLFRPAAGLLVATVLAACSTTVHRAPVEDRAVAGPRASAPVAAVPADAGATSAPAVASAADAAKPPPGIENAGKPGYYTVKPGDTLLRIGLENGQNWRDLARWNNLADPNALEVGQVLRVVAPAPAATAQPVASAGQIESRPLDGRTAAPPAAASASAAAPAAPPVAPRDPDDNITWAWPAAGAVAVPFDEAKNKGLGIAGKAGDPVLAAADGRVVYAGSGLRGYGNLLIIKHNATYLTAYAHNQTLLVKEDEVVRRGQKIAEMGSTDADRVLLHFEIRRAGKPVDPAKLLPQR